MKKAGDTWDMKEFDVLFDVYPTEGADGVMKILTWRSRISVQRQAHLCGVKFVGKPRQRRNPPRPTFEPIVISSEALSSRWWRTVEIAKLKEIYPEHGSRGVCQVLRHRSPGSVNEKAMELGIKTRAPRGPLPGYKQIPAMAG